MIVRQFLFNVLTLSDWAISGDHPWAIRTIVENWIGPGYHLLEQFEKGDLEETCPNFFYAKSEIYGNASERRVSKSVRKTIACCEARNFPTTRGKRATEARYGSNQIKRLLIIRLMQKSLEPMKKAKVYSMLQAIPY